MWINPWLLLVGVTTGVLAGAIFFMYHQLAGRDGARTRGSPVTSADALALA
jgi:hypothetical protein